MSNLSNLLNNSAYGEEDLRELLILLNKHLKDGGFHLIPKNGNTLSSGLKLNLSKETLHGLVERCKKGRSTVKLDSPSSTPVYAMPVWELDAVLIFVLSNSPVSEKESYGIEAVRLCIELFFSQQSSENLITVQKQQGERRAAALEERYRINLTNLVRATEEAEAANIAKREFLANISHEMRTPLNGIIGMADLVTENERDADQKELLEIINHEAKALHNLINDVLDFSKIEAGMLELEEISFNPRLIIEGLADSFAYRAGQKGLEVTTFLSSDIPHQLLGDPGRLRQIIMNIVGNAFKFTSSGNIDISAEVAEDLEDSLILKFKIKDTGIGIPKTKLKTIFDPFKQADGSTTREYGGTGLGTTISKQFTEMMGGAIGVESEEGKGSTFWFTALFGKLEKQNNLISEKEHDLSEVKVAVVNAQSRNRFIISEYLRSWGCRTVEAKAAKEALATLRKSISDKECCDLVVTDIELPDMNGFDMAKEIREDKQLNDIPIIVLTSTGWRGDGKRCNDLGINGYLTKPIKKEDLHKIIAFVMGCTAEGGRTNKEVITKHTIAEAAKLIHILVVEDHPTNQKVISRYLNRAGYKVDIAENGLEGFKAFKQKQYNLILMDMQMPVMDGYEATAEIRGYESEVGCRQPSSRIPIVAVTAHAAGGDRERCLNAGTDDYITKPLSREVLLNLVAKWTAQEQAAPDETTGPPVQEKLKAPEDAPMNYEYALDQYEGDKEFLIEILTEFLGKTKTQINDIKQAASEGNPEVVKREGHSIKGGASILTAKDLSDAGFELQILGESGSLEGSAELIHKLEQEFHRLEAYSKGI